MHSSINLDHSFPDGPPQFITFFETHQLEEEWSSLGFWEPIYLFQEANISKLNQSNQSSGQFFISWVINVPTAAISE